MKTIIGVRLVLAQRLIDRATVRLVVAEERRWKCAVRFPPLGRSPQLGAATSQRNDAAARCIGGALKLGCAALLRL